MHSSKLSLSINGRFLIYINIIIVNSKVNFDYFLFIYLLTNKCNIFFNIYSYLYKYKLIYTIIFINNIIFILFKNR